jgi:sugar lactone lactonase YvrE
MGLKSLELLWDPDCSLAESPVWDASRDCLYFIDIRGGRLFRYGISTQDRQQWSFGEPVGSMGVCASGNLVVATARRILLFDPATGVPCHVLAHLDEPAGNRFNDGKVGPDGCFWVGTRDGRRDQGRQSDGNGGLYRVSPDGRLEKKSEGYLTSNGLAWSPDGTIMYHADSVTGIVDAWAFDTGSGTISDRRRLVRLGPEAGSPDGAACDVEGNYWSAGPSAGCINQISPSGEIKRTIQVNCEAPTMLCLADDWMYVTSMRRKKGDKIVGREYDMGGLFRLRAPAEGVRVELFLDS